MTAQNATPAEIVQAYGELVPNIPFRAVALHPMADEHGWLQANDMKPEDCTHVELYWATDDHVIFVAIQSVEASPFVTYRQQQGGAATHYFYVTTLTPQITSQVVVAILGWLSEWAIHHENEMLNYTSEKALHIARTDILLDGPCPSG